MSARPKPTDLKAIRGTLRNPGAYALEPDPIPGRPPVPPYFDGQMINLWNQFADIIENMKVLTLSDGAALESLVLAQHQVRELRMLINASGWIYESFTGGESEGEDENGDPLPPTPARRLLKANPAVAMLNGAETRLRHLLIEFGMTPASRSKVKTVGDASQTTNSTAAQKDYFGAKAA